MSHDEADSAKKIKCVCAAYTPNLHGETCAICERPYPDRGESNGNLSSHTKEPK